MKRAAISRSRFVPHVTTRRGRRAEPVPAEVYDESYYLCPALEGLDEYLAGTLSVLRRREVELLDVRAGQRVLDLGCGRGETSVELARLGADVVPLDYAAEALRLTSEGLRRGDHAARCLQADGTALPFPDGSFDRILLGDVVEHLPWDLSVRMLEEVGRVVVPGGRVVVHTSPNVWFIWTVKPLVVAAMRVLGRTEVLGRFAEYDRLRDIVHPNELSPRSLPRLFAEAGLRADTWVDADVMRSGESEWTAALTRRWAGRVLGRVASARPFRLVLGNDLYGVHERPSGEPAGTASS